MLFLLSYFALSFRRILARGEAPDRIVREIAKFGAHNHRLWKDGMTTLTAVARLNPWLCETTLVYALALISIFRNALQVPSLRYNNYLRARCSKERFGCGFAASSLCGSA
jgi:hypothetical protein